MDLSVEHRKTPTQKAIWNEVVGDAWVKYAPVHDVQAEPFGRAVLDALGDLAGARVLDVGCGTGAASNQLIERGAADVLGVDLSVPMIEAARADAREGARFEVGDVTELEPDGTYDLVFSRFGVMFFDDPIGAFSHLRALTTDKGRLGFCCWTTPFENPLMSLPVMASASVLGPPQLPGPGEPSPFSLGSQEIVHDVLTGAGWSHIECTRLAMESPHPAGDARAVAEVAVEFNPVLAGALRRNPTKLPDAREAITSALRSFERDGVVHLGSSAFIVTASAA